MGSACLTGLLVLGAACTSLACGSSTTPPKSDSDYRVEVTSSIHDALLVDVETLVTAAQDLADAAPLPADRGWDAQADAVAIQRMKASWMRARSAWEHVEGALEPIFPDSAFALDSRYEEQLAPMGPGGDPYPFDGEGVTGLDAVERVLYADVAPDRVVLFEKTLPGYAPAAFPATPQEAADFKNALCARLVRDARTIHDGWGTRVVDVGGAFDGLVALVSEQKAELANAKASQEESRYSQRTMSDLRDNLEGTEAIYGIFRGWLVARGGTDVDGKIAAGLHAVEALYAAVPGTAVPRPPETWNPDAPTADDRATAYGRLYSGVATAVDRQRDGSVVSEMSQAAILLRLGR
jgi:iron uptake system component EfeO